MKIGYLVPEFPGQTHGFFWREILQIEAAGHDVAIFSTRRPRDRTKHAFSELATARTLYLTDLRIIEGMSWLSAALASLDLSARSNVRKSRKMGQSWLKFVALADERARSRALCGRAHIQNVHGHSCADARYVLVFSKLMHCVQQ